MTTPQIKIEVSGERIAVHSPFNPEFPNAARQLGGRWDAVAKVWAFDFRDEARVRELCRSIYGTDGTATEIVTVRVRDLSIYLNGNKAFGLGRELAYRPGRDNAVRLGAGVVVLEGRFPNCGGSVKNPRLLGPCDPRPILEVRDVPVALAEAERAEHPDAIEIVAESAPMADALTPAESSLIESLRALSSERRALVLAALQ